MNTKNITISIIIVLVVAGGIYFLTNKNSSSTSGATGNESTYSSFPVSGDVQTPAPTPAPIPAPVSKPASHNVSIQNFSFSSSSLTVKKGDTVVWTNKDSVPHTVTGDNGGPSSGTLSLNQTYSFTFKTAGSFPYHCSIHPSMTATVTVKE